MLKLARDCERAGRGKLRTSLAGFGLAATVASCGTSSPITPGVSMTPVGRLGTLTGAIFGCSGLPPALAGTPTPVAGIVDVLPQNNSHGGQSETAEQSVAAGGRFAFRLPAGTYLLTGRWAGTNLAAPREIVRVLPGQPVEADLVYRGCL